MRFNRQVTSCAVWFVVAAWVMATGPTSALAADAPKHERARSAAKVPPVQNWKQEAKAALLKQDFSRAVRAYERVAAVDPQWAAVRIGPLYFHLNQHRKAEVFYAKMVRKYPKRAWYWYCLATALRGQGKHGASIVAARRALRLAPTDPSPLFGLGLSYQALGKDAKAAEALSRYVSLERRSWARQWVVRAGTRLALLEKALKARRTGPRSSVGKAREPSGVAVVRKAVAAALSVLDNGDRARAERMLRKTMGSWPRVGLPYLVLSEVLERAGDLAGAQMVLKLGLRRVERFNDGRMHLASLLWNRGRREDAAFHLHIALDGRLSAKSLRIGASLLKSMGKPDEAAKLLVRAKQVEARLPAMVHVRKSGRGRSGRPSLLGLSVRKPAAASRGGSGWVPSVVKSRRPSRARAGARPVRLLPLVRRTVPRAAVGKGRLPKVLKGTRALLIAGRFGAVEQRARAVLKQRPNNYYGNVFLAAVLIKQYKNAALALRAAKKASRRAPNEPEPWKWAGLAALRLRERQRSKRFLETYMRLLGGRTDADRSSVEALLRNLKGRSGS
ncbi:MAG: hypothetical protein J7M25_06155 [Deltaproteobacteria bacterium]|nr:hypothetical protein [Deltaproteobacteria bacterium]